MRVCSGRAVPDAKDKAELDTYMSFLSREPLQLRDILASNAILRTDRTITDIEFLCRRKRASSKRKMIDEFRDVHFPAAAARDKTFVWELPMPLDKFNSAEFWGFDEGLIAFLS